MKQKIQQEQEQQQQQQLKQFLGLWPLSADKNGTRINLIHPDAGIGQIVFGQQSSDIWILLGLW